MVTADFNGDGKLDFFIDMVDILVFGDGQGGFSSQPFFSESRTLPRRAISTMMEKPT
jgi:hypothetical protein